MANTFVKASEGNGTAKFRTDLTPVGSDLVHTPVSLLGFYDELGNVIVVSPATPAPVQNPSPSALQPGTAHIGSVDVDALPAVEIAPGQSVNVGAVTQPDTAISDEVVAISTGSGTSLGTGVVKAGVLISVPASAISAVKVIASGSVAGITLQKGTSQFFVVDNLNKLRVKALSGSEVIEYFAS
jgi:hypothetical protein